MVVVIEKRKLFVATALGLVVATFLAHPAFSGADEGLPPELGFIEEAIKDEQEAVDSVRRFDRAQQALAAWDMDNAGALAATGDAEGADKHVESARRRIALIDQAYRLILNRYSENGRALTYHGELLYDRLGDQVTAIKNWRLAAAFDDTLSEPHNNLGLHYSHLGDYVMGLRELDQALELDEDHPDYHFNMAQLYLVYSPQVEKIRKWNRKKVYREAMKHSKLAAELAPDDYTLQQDYAVNFFAAENHGIEADWKEAAEAWSTARVKARNEIEVFYTWLNEARVWIEQEDDKRAEPCLQEALALRPESGVALSLLEQVREQGD